MPTLNHEHTLWARGYQRVAGVDEAGRGPLAGPVVVAAVILDETDIPDGLNDSKQVSEKRRALLFDQILETAAVSLISVSAATIDAVNIRQATLIGMAAAIRHLSPKADHVLIDGRDVPPALAGRATGIVKGDTKSLSIAAASICAKVHRDRLMIALERHYPGYGFAQHKGYGTALHKEKLAKLGPCLVHRRSFAPLRQVV